MPYVVVTFFPLLSLILKDLMLDHLYLQSLAGEERYIYNTPNLLY